MNVKNREIFIHCNKCSKIISTEYLDEIECVLVCCPECTGECVQCKCGLKKFCFSKIILSNQTIHLLQTVCRQNLLDRLS